jgi:NADH-quinone oxidoreductase subunit E
MIDTAKVWEIAQRYDRSKENLIAILLECQEEFHHLPREVIEAVSKAVDVPVTRVLGIGTFFRVFSLEPVGKYPVHVCMGTACHVQGAPKILEALERELGVKRGHTTKDLQFTLDTVNCIGCCGLAPVITVGQDVHGKLQQTQLKRILKRYEKKGD